MLTEATYINKVQPIFLLRSPIDGTPLVTPIAPHIQPSYYAAIIAAEALAQVQLNGTAVGQPTRAVEVAIDHPKITGYAFYYSTMEGRVWQVSKLLLINLQAYLRNQGNTSTSHPYAPRGKVHVDLSFSAPNVSFVHASPSPQAMTIKRLSIPYADDTSGLTWGGQTYETSNGLVSGKLKLEMSFVAGGVDLWDTEAILIYFD